MDTTVLDIRLISREEYEMFVKDKDYNMFQHPRYLRFMEERGDRKSTRLNSSH